MTSVAQAAPVNVCPSAVRADNQAAAQIKDRTSVQPSKCPGERQTRSRLHTSLPRALGPWVPTAWTRDPWPWDSIAVVGQDYVVFFSINFLFRKISKLLKSFKSSTKNVHIPLTLTYPLLTFCPICSQ